MSKQRAHWQRAVPLLIVVLLTLSALVIGSAFATAQGHHDHSDVDHHHGFTPRSEQQWPPRPTGARGDMVTIGDATPGPPAFVSDVAAFPAQARVQSSAAMPMDQALAEALGEDWIHISSSPAVQGKGDFVPAEETYFSRDLNQTVIASGDPWAQDVFTFSPEELQPVIAPAETAEAAELGRAWLLERGFTGVEFYEGAGIRAFNDGEFYPTRMVYITFASDGFADPEYSALVDLTNGVVVEGGAL